MQDESDLNAEMVEAFRDGAPISDLCREYAIDEEALREVLLAAGFPLRPRRRDRPEPVLTRSEVCELYVDGVSLDDIGRRYGVSASRVSQMIKAHTQMKPTVLRVQHGWLTHQTSRWEGLEVERRWLALVDQHGPRANVSQLAASLGRNRDRLCEILQLMGHHTGRRAQVP